MRNRYLVPRRERALSAAEGRVLKFGIGSGINLSGSRVSQKVGKREVHAGVLDWEEERHLLTLNRRLVTGSLTVERFRD